MKIIVVDDEISALSTFLPNVVDDGDVECKMFMSKPRSALEYARIHAVDVAFLDVKMPEIDGLVLAERLIAIRPEIKIVFISAYVSDEQAIIEKLGDNVAGFCHKPYSKEQLLNLIATLKGDEKQARLFIKTFDFFDLFVNGVAVNFSSLKAKELLALLTDANGCYVTMDKAIGNLWPNKNADLSKRLYRDAVTRLRLTLQEVGAKDLVTFERGRAVINTSAASCDLWDFLKNGGNFSGRYLPAYDWSIITESSLERLKQQPITKRYTLN